MPVDVKALDVDFAACSAHKLYAPMGMGALYARRELLDKMPPFLSGGDMIGAVHEHSATWAEGPRKFEAGTRNVIQPNTQSRIPFRRWSSQVLSSS